MCTKLRELEEALASFAGDFDAAVISAAEAEVVMERAARMEHMGATLKALAAAVGILLAAIVSLLLTRSIVGPLRRLAGQAQLMSSGNVDIETAAFEDVKGDDVTHEVATAFDRLGNALRYYAATRGEAPAGDLR